MRKKIILLTFAIVACLSFLVGCNSVGLEKYKTAKSDELQAYADAKGKENYSEENWRMLCEAVATGKSAILDATTKSAVLTIFNNSKSAINAIETSEKCVGKFYTLQEAYDKNLLSLDALRTIADYHAHGTSPAEPLSSENVNNIKEIAARDMRENKIDPVVNAKAEDFFIMNYFGTYNECVVFMINDPYHFYPAEVLNIDEIIAGVCFHYTTPNRIKVLYFLIKS